MDNISEIRLGEVHPKLAAAIRQMAEIVGLDNPPISLRVTQGLRTWAQQAALYAQGRTAQGQIVTNAQPGQSWHNFGLAVDLVPIGVEGPDWNIAHPQWPRLVAVGVSLGLTAGAQFHDLVDWPHFQLTGRFPISPDDEVRQIYLNEGMQAVWNEANIT